MGADHVKVKVSQYAMRQHTKSTPSGSQIPRFPTSCSLALDARSIGTSRTIWAGKNMAKKMGASMYAGVVRRGR